MHAHNEVKHGHQYPPQGFTIDKRLKQITLYSICRKVAQAASFFFFFFPGLSASCSEGTAKNLSKPPSSPELLLKPAS
jgi:hypothetical protein